MVDETVLQQLVTKIDALSTQVDNLTRTVEGSPKPSSPSSSMSTIAKAQEGRKTSDGGSSSGSGSGGNNSTSSLYPNRVILTTYPHQHGIHPVELEWGAADAKKRGPIVASRHAGSIKKRNAIGAYGGSYCVYRALAVAIGDLPTNHRPNYELSEPAFQIGPHPTWADPSKSYRLIRGVTWLHRFSRKNTKQGSMFVQPLQQPRLT